MTASFLLRCLPVKPFLFTPAGTGEQPPFQRRCVHTKLLRGVAFAAVEKAVLAGVVLPNDNGKCPQIKHAHFYVEHWDTMLAENIGYLLWGGVGTGKS